MAKVNTIGLAQANKCMHLSAMAYNLKKYMKFTRKRAKSGANATDPIERPGTVLEKLFWTLLGHRRFPVPIPIQNRKAPKKGLKRITC